jgi:hypothetical protein
LTIKVKPNITAVEVHPQLSINEHPVDGALVSGAGGVKFLPQQTRAHLVYNMPPLLPSKKSLPLALKAQTSKGKFMKVWVPCLACSSRTLPPSPLRFSEWPILFDP